MTDVKNAPRPHVVAKVAEIVQDEYRRLDGTGRTPRAHEIEARVAAEIDGPVAWVEILDGWYAGRREAVAS